MTYDIIVTDASGKAASHRVELKRLSDGWECAIDGKAFAFDSMQPEADVLSLLVGDRSYEIRRDAGQNGQSGERSIVVAGARYGVEIIDTRSLRGRKAKAGATDGPKKVKAPMPGKVVRILVAEGATVEAGQGVVVIEAMKMQNELKSPKAGVVKKLVATEGMAVNAGDTLAVVE
jgi:biotin carboxyl carrier protein